MNHLQHVDSHCLRPSSLNYLAALCGLVFYAVGSLGGPPSANDLETIANVYREVIDLADIRVLLRSQSFLNWREGLTLERCSNIVEMLKEDILTVQQSALAIFGMQVLPENEYWAVTTPLLTSNRDARIIEAVILSPLDYGPAYANAYGNPEIRKVLQKLSITNPTVKGLIDHILSGAAAKAYREFIALRKYILLPRKASRSAKPPTPS